MRRLSTLVIWTLLAFGACGASLAATATQPIPARSAQTADLQTLRALLKTPESELDLARAKLAIDRQIDPEVDVTGTLRQLDALAARIKARFPATATSQTKLQLLVTSLSQPGPWNDYRPFSYDLDDPFGKDIRNKLLSTYLATRRGNCVSMPILLVIVGQELGLDITLATAPLHVLAKFRNDQGQWINIEATSFGTKGDASYQQELGITPKAVANGIYLRPLGRRESVAVMMNTLMEFYREEPVRRMAVADLVLQTDPKEITAMLHKGGAYYDLLKQRYMSRYRSPAAIPPEERAEFEALSEGNRTWFAKAEALGWTETTQAQDVNYLQSIQRTKDAQQGGR
ncbi:hypothetical protein H7691_17265 [Stenotrophomonas sp. CW117]|nr:hypothetical protein H7691_17265 [Stenotrophomonas sp. CW117]